MFDLLIGRSHVADHVTVTRLVRIRCGRVAGYVPVTFYSTLLHKSRSELQLLVQCGRLNGG